MKYTIHDVARELGVSARTISRVINDQDGVGRATRDKISTFIEKVGFQPHSGARSLRSRRVDCIGVVLPASPEELPLSQELLGFLFSKLSQVFSENQEFVTFDMNPPTVNGQRDYARGVWQNRFDACVVAGALHVEDKTLGRLHASGLPYVALGRHDDFPECNTSTVDYEHGAYLSTRHLIDRGHRRIGLLFGLAGLQPGIERQRGYQRALDEAGIPLDPNLMRWTSFASPRLAGTVHRLLANHSVTAIVDCSGAEDAEALREGARRSGRAFGKDLDAVVWTYTCDATVMAEASAHVWLPVYEASAEGLELLGDLVYQRRDQPFQVLYRPVIYEAPRSHEIPKPKPVFTVHH